MFIITWVFICTQECQGHWNEILDTLAGGELVRNIRSTSSTGSSSSSKFVVTATRIKLPPYARPYLAFFFFISSHRIFFFISSHLPMYPCLCVYLIMYIHINVYTYVCVDCVHSVRTHRSIYMSLYPLIPIF